MSRFYLCIILSCLVCFSIQQNVRLTQSSKTPSEGEVLTLRCVTASGYDLLQWSLNDKIVVESTTTNNILAPGKSPDQYVATVSNNKIGKRVFRLKINPVTRNDTGLWECMVSSFSGIPASSVSRTNVSVIFLQDPEYPACEIPAFKPLSCTTQGDSLVVLSWAEETHASIDIRAERNSSLATRNSIVYSELEPYDLRPPESTSDDVVCKILENRHCSILKRDIYALASLNVSQGNHGGEIAVSCSVEPSYFRSFLDLSWKHTEKLQGNVVNNGDNSKEVNFGEVTPNLDGIKIICTLVWGVIDYKNVSLRLVVNVPPTTNANFPTPSKTSYSTPSIRPFLEERTTKQFVSDKDDNVNTVEPGPREDTSMSRAAVTPTKETGLIFTSKDGKTKFLAYKFKELEFAPSKTLSPKSTILQEMTTKQSVDKDENVKTVERGQRNVIKVNTKPDSRGVVTPTTVTEADFIFTFMDETSKFSHEFGELESKSTMSSSKSTIRPFLEEMTTKPTFDKKDKKTVKPWPRVYITVTTKPESLDVVTPTTEPIFTLMDGTTEFYYEFEKIGAQGKIHSIFTTFPFMAPIMLCTAFVLGMVCTCILCKLKKRVLCL
ncbi:hypothetical protein HOLleu_12903 [Holothuria leucospilota]|uniref:Ig-like domain-containing protein n=1 Tax=Holothuria leucospilota TaxID=206669 RepID=A0A9Q1CAZ7_HOLLE|nr:hypothetical protein HOLleu_12903 [Holothuria leucospilota]